MAGYFRNLARAATGRKTPLESVVAQLSQEFKAATFNAESLAALTRNLGLVPGDRTGTSYLSLAENGYVRNACLFRGISDIATNLASVPLDVFTDAKTKSPDHPLAKLLRKPSLREARATFMTRLAAYFLIDGNSFLRAIAPVDEPRILETWRPDAVTVRENPGARGLQFDYRVEGMHEAAQFVNVDADARRPVLHLKTFHPTDPLRGLSPLMAARTPIDRHNAADEWNLQLQRNAARPSGMFMVEPGKEGAYTLKDDELEALKAELSAFFSGPVNTGKVGILGGGVKWEQMGLSPMDMDWSVGKASAARDACNAIGYPAMLLAIPGDNTFQNQREARLALWEQTIIPMLNSFAEEMSAWLSPYYGDRPLEIRPNLDQVSALTLRRERVFDRVASANWLTINEKREETGFDRRPEPEADVVLAPYNLIPLGAPSVLLQQDPENVEPDPEEDPEDESSEE